ncbi:MAG: glycosyltransferase family 39 protein [Chloroflexota bacterium]|nr:glycosyltransferase family 39 protein [Chloroflexota bacterium]
MRTRTAYHGAAEGRAERPASTSARVLCIVFGNAEITPSGEDPSARRGFAVNQTRRQLPALALILLVALALRLSWIAFVHPDPTDGRFDDTAWYRVSAHFFANGDGYVNPFTGTPTAGWPPGYPVFLGSIFGLFGEGLAQTYILNAVLSGLTVLVVYAIGLILFDRRTALVSAAAMAVWPGQIYFTSLTLSEPLFTLLFSLAMLLMLLATRVDRGKGAIVLMFGIVTGLAVLTRGQALLLLPLAFIVWGLAEHRWRPAVGWVMLAAFVVGVMLAPWVARNQRQLGSPVLLATNFGVNVWIGNHDNATGRRNIPEPEAPQPSRLGVTQPQFEVKADNLALRKGLDYMRSHPARELQLTLTKVRAMYESDATALDWNSRYRPGFYASPAAEDWLRAAANGFWFAAIALSGVGLISTRARLGGVVGLLPLLVLVWTGTHLLFFGDARFHYPIVFAIALLGARGLVVLFEALRRPEPNLRRGYATA